MAQQASRSRPDRLVGRACMSASPTSTTLNPERKTTGHLPPRSHPLGDTPGSSPAAAPPGRRHAWRDVALLNAISFALQLAHMGILYPLMGIWLEERGMAAGQIGLVLGSVWAGMLVGNLLTPHLLAHANARTVAMASSLLSAVIALAMPLVNPTLLLAWVAVATGFGFAVGLRWISVEGWLLPLIDGPLRARLISIHETMIYAAQALGPAILGGLSSMKGAAFYAAAGVAAFAVLPLALADKPAAGPSAPRNGRRPIALVRDMWRARRADPSVSVGLLSGVIDGALFGMLSVHLLRAGFTAGETASLLALFGLGGLLSQIPLGWMADRQGSAVAGSWLGWTGIAGAALLAWPGSLGAIGIGISLLGALAACGLSLATIVAAEHAERTAGDVVVAISRVSIAFTLGSSLGPLIAGVAIDAMPAVALPGMTVIGCLGLLQWSRARRPAST
jgi:predicted MFS family arabinose efflux permease